MYEADAPVILLQIKTVHIVVLQTQLYEAVHLL